MFPRHPHFTEEELKAIYPDFPLQDGFVEGLNPQLFPHQRSLLTDTIQDLYECGYSPSDVSYFTDREDDALYMNWNTFAYRAMNHESCKVNQNLLCVLKDGTQLIRWKEVDGVRVVEERWMHIPHPSVANSQGHRPRLWEEDSVYAIHDLIDYQTTSKSGE